MKKIFIAFLGALAITVSAQAQKKSGAIQFESIIDPIAVAEASGRQISEQMKARMPKSIKANYELLYNATNASYMPVTETEDSNSGGGGRPGGGPRFGFGGFGGGNREYYYTFADQKVVEVFDLMDTTYVMPTQLKVASINQIGNMGGRNNQNQENNAVQFLDVPPTVEIIKSEETKKIINLNCKKVTIKTTRKAKILDMEKDVVDETVLWYTNDLGFNFSPMPNLWTEGTVLAIEIKGGGTTAKSIEYRGVSNKDVTAPKKAIAITPEEYQAKQAAMMARFRNNNNNRQGATGRVN